MRKILVMSLILCLILCGCGKKEAVKPVVVAQTPNTVQSDVQTQQEPQREVASQLTSQIVAAEPSTTEEQVQQQVQSEVYKGVIKGVNKLIGDEITDKDEVARIACAKYFDDGSIIEYRYQAPEGHHAENDIIAFDIIQIYHTTDSSDGLAINYIDYVENDPHILDRMQDVLNDDRDSNDEAYLYYHVVNYDDYINDYLEQYPESTYLISPIWKDDIKVFEDAAKHEQWDYCWNYLNDQVNSGLLYYKVLSYGTTDMESKFSDGEYRWYEHWDNFMNGQTLDYLQ